MNPKAWNWRLWAGFALSWLALFCYLSLFTITRSVFWLSLALLVIGVVLLIQGLRRTYSQPDAYRGKVAGPILAVFTVLAVGAFGFCSYMMPKAYSVARNAPIVGQKAPELVLADTNGKPVNLTDLLSGATASPAPRGVLLVFYRGYW